MQQPKNTFIARLTLSEKYQKEGFDEEAMQIIGEHGAYLDELGKQGTLIFAGRTMLLPGDKNLFGIALFKGGTIEEIEKIRDNDPAYMKGIQLWEIFPFMLAVNYFENGLIDK